MKGVYSLRKTYGLGTGSQMEVSHSSTSNEHIKTMGQPMNYYLLYMQNVSHSTY